MIHHEERFLHDDESSITKGWGYESLKSAIVPPKQLGDKQILKLKITIRNKKLYKKTIQNLSIEVTRQGKWNVAS